MNGTQHNILDHGAVLDTGFYEMKYPSTSIFYCKKKIIKFMTLYKKKVSKYSAQLVLRLREDPSTLC